jgi:ribosomal protein S7
MLRVNYKKKKNFYLYEMFLGFLTKKGHKIHAQKILNSTFKKVSKKTGFSFNKIFLNIFLKLNTFVEVKKVKVRRSSYFVPFPIKFKRRIYLMLKWIMLAVKQNKKKISLTEKLAFEITNIIKGYRSKSLKLRQDNLSFAFRNRSNSHYR